MYKFELNVSGIIVLFIIFILTVTLTAKINYHNGKFDLCKDQNKHLTNDGKCLTCEQTGRKMVDNECILIQQQPYPQIFIEK